MGVVDICNLINKWARVRFGLNQYMVSNMVNLTDPLPPLLTSCESKLIIISGTSEENSIGSKPLLTKKKKKIEKKKEKKKTSNV